MLHALMALVALMALKSLMPVETTICHFDRSEAEDT